MLRTLVATTCTPDDRKALASIRALARAEEKPWVAGDRFRGRAFFSRYASGRVRTPHPAEDEAGFVGAIRSAADRLGLDAVLPATDATLAVLARRQGELEGVVASPLPDPEALRVVSDKQKTLDLARRLGLDVPETRCPADLREAREAASELGYPCVVKPRRGTGAIGVHYPADADALERLWERWPARTDLVFDFRRPLVQELVPGETHDVCVLCDRGRVRVALTQRRLVTWPRHGGVGVVVETTDDPILRERATVLMEALAWNGPAQVEFRVDPASGRRCLGEVNGRLWGALELSIAAGFDVPTLACRMAAEGGLDPARLPKLAPPGLRFRWPYPYALLGARPLWRLVAPGPGSRSDLDLSDPLPHLADAAWAAARLLRRGRQSRYQGLDQAAPPPTSTART